jgi:eukaryotic-like serine/threonine-protein kinase
VPPGTSPAVCALCLRGHDPERACTTAAGDDAGRIGEVIADRYELCRLLGSGGMGVVFEARHKLIGRRFALKLLHPQYAQQPSMLTRFQREARAAGALENEHIAAVTDFGFAADGAPYLVMEHLDGEDLAAHLARSGPLPVTRAVSFVIQACRGLAAAHARDIVHRDLKPANLFLTRRGDGSDLVKVLDFGIAKLVDGDGTESAITGTGKLLGTACYMPPEQAKGESDLDHRIDIYALGAILYELLSGTKAHPGTNYNAVLFHILTEKHEPIAARRPDVPQGLGRIIERAMASDRAERYQSVTALMEALRPFSVGPEEAPRTPAVAPELARAETMATPPTVAPYARALPSGRPSRGRAIAMALAACGIVLLVGGKLLVRPHPSRAPAVTTAMPLPPPPAAPPPTAPPPAAAPAKPEARAAPAIADVREEPAQRRKPARHGTRATATVPAPLPHAETPSNPSNAHRFDTRNPYDE